ncbi:hypothetical protein BT93_E0610 [Corymbia citriodora subsp. variegata]|nr:hypothetical protein BT93_E0610 [Corymbia citriodora subsp. variegata]
MISLHLPTLAYCFLSFCWETMLLETLGELVGVASWMDHTELGIKRGTTLMTPNKAMNRNACLDYSKSHQSLSLYLKGLTRKG